MNGTDRDVRAVVLLSFVPWVLVALAGVVVVLLVVWVFA